MNGMMQPLWTIRPDLPAHSIGWRMGGGEDVHNGFYRWFSALSDDDAAAYAERNPAPAEWHDFYAMIRANPWNDND